MIKNIIFDWTGVIKDCLIDNVLIVNSIFKEYGALEISISEFQSNYTQPYMSFYNKYLPNLTLEQEQISYQKAHDKCAKPHPYSGIIDIINRWKQKGVQMVVVSSDAPETLLPEIQSFGLAGVFVDVITGAYDKKEGVKKLMVAKDFNPEETIFIGDSNHEIEAGKELGIKTGAVTWGFCTEEKLSSLNPDYMIHNIDELKEIIN